MDRNEVEAEYRLMKSNISHRAGLMEEGKISGVLLGVLLIIVVGVGAGAGAYYRQQQKVDDLNKQITVLQSKVSRQSTQQSAQPAPSTPAATTYKSQKGVEISVYTPIKNTKVASPVGVIGKVPGNWSFEANFPAQLKDSSGNVVAKGMAQVLGDWMTDRLVPFSIQLTYSSAASGTGTLVLQKDNPSGQTKNDDYVSIPIHF